MKIISLIGQKGGTGKTTLAQILAVAFELDGTAAKGIDLDPQGSFCRWGDERGRYAPEVVETVPVRLEKAIETARGEGVGICIIDTAGRAEQASMAATKIADLVLVPMQPSAADLRTVEAVTETLRLAGKQTNAFAILTRVKGRGSRHEEAAQFLQDNGLLVCPHIIGDRVTYQDAAAAGMAPQEFEPSGRAAHECRNVYKFVSQQVGK